MSDTKTDGDCHRTRRDFLQTSSTVLAGAVVVNAIGAHSHAAGSETIRVGLVGCGGRGTAAAIQALSTAGPVKLVAMADAFEDHLERRLEAIKEQMPEQVDVPPERRFVGFDAYKDAIDCGIDLVILTTPPGFRPMHFEYAVERGKHVFMEKPVAVDAPGVRRVLEAGKQAARKNLKVGVGLQRHHHSGYQEAIQRIWDGQIGRIITLRAYWNSVGVWVRARTPEMTEMEYQMRNWYYFNWLGGDHIVEQHIHNLDVCNWVMKAHPDFAQGQGGRQVRTGKDHGEIFDHHAVEFAYGDHWDSAVRMFSQCRHIRQCWRSVSEHVHGTKGLCRFENSTATISDHDGQVIWQHPGKVKDPYQVEHDVLFDAVRNDRSHNEAEYGALSTMTAIYGRMASYSGDLIEWDKAFNSDIALVPDAYDWNANPPTLPDGNNRYPIAKPGLAEVV